MNIFAKLPKISIFYGIFPSPFGDYALLTQEKGICALFFLPFDLQKAFPHATLIQDETRLLSFAKQIFEKNPQLPLKLSGTPFQVKVWETLKQIPFGKTISYEEVAKNIGYPKGVRAVANAIAKNPVSILIPCHRVIYKSGASGNYRWGTSRKKNLLEWETLYTPRN